MKKIISLFISLLVLVSCNNVDGSDTNSTVDSSDVNSTTHDDQVTGPLIGGIYSFETYTELMDFYEIFKRKNTERFLLLDLDSLECDVKYYFISNGVDAAIISDNIYDYDFPRTSFEITIDSMNLKLSDISKAEFSDEPSHTVQSMKEENNRKYYEFLIDENEVGLLQSEDAVGEEFINYLNDEFKDKFKEVFENL